jgi:hypothetical protein
MPDTIIETPQQKEWNLANALGKFLPDNLEWRLIGGYPILYQKGFWGSLKGSVAFLTDGTRITVERGEWKAAIDEALQKYKAANGITIEVKYSFDTPKKFKKSW